MLTFLSFSPLNAQCTGTSTVITICDKEADASLQMFNLFDVLDNETPGGSWIAESNFDSEALDVNTGILNLWSINTFGEHLFTYSNPACDNSTATVTINLGGYPGESNQNSETNNVCQVLKEDDDDLANIIDLFIFLGAANNIISPDIGGVWTESPSNLELGAISNEFFNFGNVPIGIYTFTYATPTVGNCAERSAIIDIEVRRSPNPGIPINISLCETDDMSSLTAVNLFSRLEDEDTNGVWTDINTPSTGELTSSTDFEIDVQNIYNNFGPGSYDFTYRVLPSHPICDEQTTIFNVCIEKQLILEGVIDVACTGNVTLSYDASLLDNNLYNLSYTVTGNTLGTFSNTVMNLAFINGVAEFSLFPEYILSASETLTIQIDDIIGGNICNESNLCTSIINVPPNDFNLYVDPTITISSTTGCELDDVLITYTNAIDEDFVLINETVSVNYSINGVNFTDQVTFVNGNAITTVSIDRFNLGFNQLIFFESNSFIHCEDLFKTPVLNLIPSPPNPIFGIVPDDRCDATRLEFNFDSPSNQFITYNPVTFDIYELGSEPEQFESRNPNASLSNNVTSDGIDININNSNDVTGLPDNDYVFVIRSVQYDNAPCRALSTAEIEGYATQGIVIGLTQTGTGHVFDARLTFRIGDPEPVNLVKTSFEVCLLSGPVTLGDLSIFAGTEVDIIITNASGQELPNTYEITQNEVFTAVFTSAITGCDLGTDEITVNVVIEASVPVLNLNTFCSLTTNTVEDLDVSNQNIIWYNSETNDIAYNLTDVIGVNNEYWAEVTIAGGCVSSIRSKADIIFVDKAELPIPLTNEFCVATLPIISDLMVESDPNATLQWYISETGEPYSSVALPLEDTGEYWVSQTIVEGCESDRVQVTFVRGNEAMALVPLSNAFCTANEAIYTLENLEFQEASISSEAEILYFSDPEGTTPIDLTVTLNNLTSPIFAKQVIAGVCFSAITEVSFSLQDIATKPPLLPVVLCAESNPTVQDLINTLQEQIESTILLYLDETTTLPLEANLELTSITGTLYASQTILEGCESIDREIVVFTLETSEITPNDFEEVHCSADVPTLNDVYLGNQIVLWFDQNNNALPDSEILQNGISYFAQLEVDTCLSERLEITITLIDVEDPLPSSAIISFCGIEEKIIEDLLEDEAGNMLFTIPESHNLLWYDSNDVSNRNLLDNTTVLEQGVVYYAVYEVVVDSQAGSVVCESNSVAILVDLTGCSSDELIIPDAFSPNADNVNDTFELKNIVFVFPDYDIEIYNRYGRVVFKGDLKTGFWDGKANQSGVLINNVLPTGVYFYVINFNRFDKKPYQGQVYLKR